MERGRANLLAKYGRQTIERHDVFSTAKDAKDFLKAYAFNQNKSFHQPVSSDHKKVAECTSESACVWHVTLTKKAESKAGSKRKNAKNSFCPEKAWFVSAMFLGHSPGCDCRVPPPA
ncbi:unnamed protein product [Phytophthora fragariaefolia]|uniref:Unnamed protein product n=1 Tax=Phytophthora fragariaefolia TaxID=1490495 RepID=A0A9W6Y5J5_9STRA|nr:unnamed protein product [Phytophthora fragariaefolia]